MVARKALLAGVGALCAACGDEGTAPVRGPALRIEALPQTRDTVQARTLQALVVEFRTPDGRLEPGVVLQFEVAAPRDSLRRFERGVYVCRLEVVPCYGDYFFNGSSASDTTDARGRAKVAVQFGRVAGPVWVVISVPEYAVRDSVRFDVEPGAPARILVTNRDTAIAVGREYTVQASVIDRFRNPRNDPLTYTSSSPDLTVDVAGKARGSRPNRAFVLVRAGAAVDTAHVSIVPPGRFIAVVNQGPDRGQVVELDFDGSNRRVLASSGAFPRVSGSGRIIVHTGNDVSSMRMNMIEPDGSLRRVTAALNPFEGEAFGHLSADGWIYFSARFPASNFAVWRIRPDGSGAERLTHGYAEWRSWPSPDGKHIAYSSYEGGWIVRTMNLETRQTSPLGNGLDAAWSPDGKRIAFLPDLGQYVWLANADGTNLQRLAGSSYVNGAVDWTADSQFLITRGLSVVELLRVADGVRLPLAYSTNLTTPVRAP